MGLRDRTRSRVRDRDLRIGQRDGGRILIRRAVEKIGALGAYIIRRVRGIDFTGIDGGDAPASGRPEHFAETMLGGIAITFGILVVLMILLWIGTFL